MTARIKTTVRKFRTTGLATAMAIVTTLLKPFSVSYIVGSIAAFFSITHCYVPLVGRYGGISAGIVFCSLLTAFKMGHSGITPFILLYHIPTFCAILYTSWTLHQTGSAHYQTHKRALLALVSLGCMVLFGVHAGLSAFPYALLWVIPLATVWLPRQYLFAHALGATFLCHAIGSVIWLYAHPMPAAVWIGLIPIAILERCTFAVSMVAIMRGIEYIQTHMVYSRNMARIRRTLFS